ncbi:MAG: hypothetical protein RR630_01275 [Coprobacillus sp.]
MDRYINSASFNMVHLCVNEYNGYTLKGVAYNNTIKDKIEFNDIKDLILKLDKMFDVNGNPFSSEEKRSFKKESMKEIVYQNKPAIVNNYCDFLEIDGKLGSIDIIVKTRLFSNWQGIIFYEDQQESFKDVVDLIEKVVFFLKL